MTVDINNFVKFECKTEQRYYKLVLSILCVM